MFRKSKVTDIERKLYENEINSLKSQLVNVTHQLEISNKYKDEYKGLVEEYKKKMKEVDALKREANILHDELSKLLETYKK